MLTSETAAHIKQRRRGRPQSAEGDTYPAAVLTGTQITEEFGIPYRSVYDLV